MTKVPIISGREWYLNPVVGYKCEVNENSIGLSGNEVHVAEVKGSIELNDFASIMRLLKFHECYMPTDICQTCKGYEKYKTKYASLLKDEK